jgi:signal transduction histidine kinase
MQQQMEEEKRMAELGKIIVPALVHDLNNLLAAISSLAQFCIEKTIPTPPLIREKIQTIYETSRSAEKLIADVLDLVKAVKSNRLAHTQVNLNELVRKMWEIAKISTAAGQILLEARLEKKLPKIPGDTEKLERVFLNLFVNAIQAVSEKGKVIVQTRFLRTENMVETEIIDDGHGIPEKYRHRIFEPFFTTKKEGTGLGLSICYLIIQQHRGEITVDSEGEGGTRVRIRLPVSLLEKP